MLVVAVWGDWWMPVTARLERTGGGVDRNRPELEYDNGTEPRGGGEAEVLVERDRTQTGVASITDASTTVLCAQCGDA